MRVLLTCVTISWVFLKLKEKVYQFYNDFCLFYPKNKNNKQKLAYKLIFLLSFVFKKKTSVSNIVPSSIAKCEERQSLPTMSKFSPQNCVFHQMKIRRTVLKQPIRIEYLNKQRPRGSLALQVNRIVD